MISIRSPRLWMGLLRALCLLVLLLPVEPPGVPNLEAATRQLEGEHTITYDIINPLGVLPLPIYSNDGYSQKVIAVDEFSKRIVVSAQLSPFSSLAPFPLPSDSLGDINPSYLTQEKARQSQDQAVVSLARSLAEGSTRQVEVVEKVLNWIAEHLSYDYSLKLPSDAVSTMKQRRGACVGYTNLAISLLRSLGIPARGVHGYLPPGYEWGITKEYWGNKINGGGFHVWTEVFYPDVGWVFHDPANSIAFVDPYHILLWIEGINVKIWGGEKGYVDVDRATTFTIVSEVNSTQLVDELPVPPKNILGRRWIARPLKASLSGSVKDREGRTIKEGKVILWKGERGPIYPLREGGIFTILGLTEGNYHISIRAKGFAEVQWSGVIEEGERKIIEIALEEGGDVAGRVVDREGRPITRGNVFYWTEGKGLGVPLQKDGTYLLEGLKPGRYRFSVRGEGYPEVNRESSVTSGSTLTLDFTLSR